MATSPMSELMQHLRRIMLLRDGAEPSDGQLLADYVNRRDQEALTALIGRHAPMVWGVCCRVLPNYHDAEDAFQATFLVLVRKAGSIASKELLANWLYGVAHQTALKARALASRRKSRERQVTVLPEPAVAGQDLWSDLRPLLDQELSRLPDKYRAVVVLCDLEGRTRKEAARQLGCPEGTVAGRLARARTMLARRLARRGLAVSSGAVAAVLSQRAAEAGVPAWLVSATLKALALAPVGPTAAGMISARVSLLTEGVLKAMYLAKFKMAVVVGLVIVSIGGTVFVSHAQDPAKDTVATGTTRRSDAPSLKDFLLTLDKQLREAAAKGDWEVHNTLVANDYLGFSSDGRFDKRAEVEGVKRRRYSDWRIRDVDFKRVSDEVAILTYLYDCKVVEGNVTQNYRSHRASFTWAQRNGIWVLVFSQDTIQAGGASGTRAWRPERGGAVTDANKALQKQMYQRSIEQTQKQIATQLDGARNTTTAVRVSVDGPLPPEKSVRLQAPESPFVAPRQIKAIRLGPNTVFIAVRFKFKGPERPSRRIEVKFTARGAGNKVIAEETHTCADQRFYARLESGKRHGSRVAQYDSTNSEKFAVPADALGEIRRIEIQFREPGRRQAAGREGN